MNSFLPNATNFRSGIAAVHNLSSKHLFDCHLSLLSKGLNFPLAASAVRKRYFIVEIEVMLHHMQKKTGVNLVWNGTLTIFTNPAPPNLLKDRPFEP